MYVLDYFSLPIVQSAVPPSTKAHPSSHQAPPPPAPSPTNPSASTASVSAGKASPRTSRPTSRAASPEPIYAKVHFTEPAAADDVTEQEGERSSDAFLPPPPPPHNTPAHVGKKSSMDVDIRADDDVSSASPCKACDEESTLAGEDAAVTSPQRSADHSAQSSPKHTITSTISAIPELDYLPHYSAYSNTVPSGAFELHTVKKSFEELMEEKNKTAHAHEGHHGVLPPPPPPGGL